MDSCSRLSECFIRRGVEPASLWRLRRSLQVGGPGIGGGVRGRRDIGGSQPPQILRQGVQYSWRSESGLLVCPERHYQGGGSRDGGGRWEER